MILFQLRKTKLLSTQCLKITLISLKKHFLNMYDWKHKPAHMYNCDESELPLEFKLPKVIAGKRAKKVWQCTSGTNTPITISGYASATGHAVPPMVIFAGKNFKSVLSKGEVWATLYGMSQNGWMDGSGTLYRMVPTPFSWACSFQSTVNAFTWWSLIPFHRRGCKISSSTWCCNILPSTSYNSW